MLVHRSDTPLAVRVAVSGDCVQLELTGSGGPGADALLGSTLTAALAETPGPVVVDCHGLVALDLRTIRSLLAAVHEAGGAYDRLRIVGARPQVRALLDRTGLSQLVVVA